MEAVMADTSPTVTVPLEPATSDAAPPEPPVDELDDLVEDVSIDGMCGVY
jgi:mycofactocin precursor